MALGLVNESGGGGNITPIIKFDAKVGEFYRVESENVNGEWVRESIEMALPFEVAIDMENIEVGYMAFVANRPDFHMVKLGERMPDKPTADHKSAFRVKLCSREIGLREFSSQSKMVQSAFDLSLIHISEPTRPY